MLISRDSHDSTAEKGADAVNIATGPISSSSASAKSATPTGEATTSSTDTSNQQSPSSISSSALTPIQLNSQSDSNAPETLSASMSSQGAVSSTATPEGLAGVSTANGTLSNRVDPGALAGGIVGAFFGGVILALVLAYFCSRRYSRISKSTPMGHKKSKKLEFAHCTDKKIASGNQTTSPAWQRLIPQPIDDETMSTLIKSLFDQITLHVDNFYAWKSFQLPDLPLDTFTRLNTNVPPGSLRELMVDSGMQLDVIKHCIAFILTSKIVPGVEADEKLVPPHLALIPGRLAPNSVDQAKRLSDLEAYSMWKTLTFYLLPELGDDMHSEKRRHQLTMAIVDDISNAFKPWETDSLDGAAGAKHLTKIVNVAYDVGVKIATQASSFTFEWQHRSRRENGHANTFVILPGFLKTADEHGHPLRSPQVLVWPVMQRSRQGR